MKGVGLMNFEVSAVCNGREDVDQSIQEPKEIISALEGIHLSDLIQRMNFRCDTMVIGPIRRQNFSDRLDSRPIFGPIRQTMSSLSSTFPNVGGDGGGIGRSMCDQCGSDFFGNWVKNLFSLVDCHKNKELRSLLETVIKIKIIETVKIHSKSNISIDLAPRPLTDYLEELVTRHTTSFYLVNLNVVMDKFFLWCNLLDRIQPFYAVKSNPDVEICRTMHLMGAGFDCSSKAELELVLSFEDINPNNIIFANPCKPISHIIYAKMNGVKMMTFDNSYELQKIFEHYPESELVLRLLPDDSHSLMPFGAKFGASFSEAKKLISLCSQLNLNLIGVSFHVGSGCYSPTAWTEAIKLSKVIFDEARNHGYSLKLLDIGGGFPGIETQTISLSSIAPDINSIIDQLFDKSVRIISEPGRFFSTECVTLSCNVISKKDKTIHRAGANHPTFETHYYISDGIYGSMNCIMFDHAIVKPNLLSHDVHKRKLQKSTIWGPTCDSIDVILKDTIFPEIHVGEWIYFKNMGAYTSAAASNFNGLAIPTSTYIFNPNS